MDSIIVSRLHDEDKNLLYNGPGKIIGNIKLVFVLSVFYKQIDGSQMSHGATNQ